MSYLFAFLTALILSLVLTPLVRRLMLRFNILDIPSESRWNQRTVALMGGIAIFASFVLATLFRVELQREVYVVVLGATVIFILGALDDYFTTHPKIKFSVQLGVAVATAFLGVVIKILPYHWLNILVTVFWIVGLTNALNLLDNMDGLSSGVTIIASVGIFILALMKHQPYIALLSAVLAGSCLGFLRYNFNPAKIFMGDCGALFLGYTLATLSILGGWQSSSPVLNSFLAPVLIVGVAIFDTTLVTVLRLTNGRLPWSGGRDHSSHRLVSIFKGNEKAAVLTLYAVGIIIGAVGLLIIKIGTVPAALALFSGVSLGLILFGLRLAKVNCYQNKNVKNADALS